MGVGVSFILLQRCCEEGGLGIVSSAALDRLVSKENRKKIQYIRSYI